jgi:hypothetical protein
MIGDITKEINKGIAMANASLKKDGVEAFAHNAEGVVVSHPTLKADIITVKVRVVDGRIVQADN